LTVTVNRRNLSEEIQEIEWHWLKPHMERSALIIVASDLDLGEAASRIAADDSAAVSAWIDSGFLAKPDREQIETWNAQPDTPFRIRIVQPYVLIQERNRHDEEKE